MKLSVKRNITENLDFPSMKNLEKSFLLMQKTPKSKIYLVKLLIIHTKQGNSAGSEGNLHPAVAQPNL